MNQQRGAGRSDLVFVTVVLVAALIAVGLGIALLDRGSDPSPAGEGATAPRSHPLYPVGPGRAAAVSVVQRNFALALAGNGPAACALESPAYRRFDAQHYRGGCASTVSALFGRAAANGVAMQLDRVRVVSFGGGKAAMTVTMGIAARSFVGRVYLRYHAGRWWITGGDDSHRDLGY